MTIPKKEETVLITGATSGIGLELAKLFALNGFNMVLVARYQQELNDAVVMMKEFGAGEVKTIAKDLSVQGAAAEIYAETKRNAIHIDMLVNDAGIGEYGFFTETSIDKELALIQLNICSLVHLTKLYLKDMVKAGRGRIMNLASVASYQPTPKLIVYAATKAFVLSFNDALAVELRETAPGITITALIPNATDTDFFRKAGMEHTRAAQEDPDDPAVVAKLGYKAFMNGELHAYGPGVKTQVIMGAFKSNESVAASARKQMEEEPEKEQNKKGKKGQQ
jgi:hypothetical protein